MIVRLKDAKQRRPHGEQRVDRDAFGAAAGIQLVYIILILFLGYIRESTALMQ